MDDRPELLLSPFFCEMEENHQFQCAVQNGYPTWLWWRHPI